MVGPVAGGGEHLFRAGCVQPAPQGSEQGCEDEEFGEASHGIAGWPFGARDPDLALPPCLPNGDPWPRIHVIVLGRPGSKGLAATLASVDRQGYPGAGHEVVAPGPPAALMADPEARSILLIRAGDLLAPGALSALALQAALTGAQVVAGLRVLFDRGVLGLDFVAHPDGLLQAAFPDAAGDIATSEGEFLLDGDAVRRAGGLDLSADRPIADLWPRLTAEGARLARIGRPVLLRHVPDGARRIPPLAEGLSIVALTDTSYTAGAGIAHRRLTEAVGLMGHRITHVVLTRESPPAAAEWTEAFPMSEAAILAGGHDLVLAGNIHGATRSTRLLARLGAHLPVAAVLHDLFPLTGRCAFPRDCPLIVTGCDAGCPTPDHYPQLAPGRIADAHADKHAVLGGPGAPLLLANSGWTMRAARELAPTHAEIAEMALAFPTGVFRPGDRTTLRRRLGIRQEDIVVMFGAVIVDAPGKGFADLSAALREVDRPGVSFVAAGRLDDPSVFGLTRLISAGPIADEAILAEWYGACDIYITASQTETLGQTPIEAGLCGTPTVAFRSCGLTTAVIEGVSGLLAPARAADLAALLARLIEDEALRRNLGAWGRIALENRNSYAASALRLQDVLAARHPKAASSSRVRFSPDLLSHFAFARSRYPGHRANLAQDAHAALRSLRLAKHVLIGRGMPFWLRRLLHVASLLGRRFGGTPR